MLVLPIKKKWFDMILSGEKKEEYRDIKPYYEKRFANFFKGRGSILEHGGTLNEWLLTDIKFFIPIKFRNGYSTEAPHFTANCQLVIGSGKPEWGAEPGKNYYILKIQNIERCAG